MARTKNEQQRYDLGVQFARDIFKHGDGALIKRGDSHFDAGVSDEYARMAQSDRASRQLLEAAKNAVPMMQMAWRQYGVGGMFECMDALRSAVASVENLNK